MATLHLMCGMAGAGKTTLAKKIELADGAVRFCPDEWIARLMGDTNHRDQSEADRFRDEIEALQWETAQQFLMAGRDAILESGFWAKTDREEKRKTARDLGARVCLHLGLS